MLNPQAKLYMSQGYAKLGEITHKIAINLKKGKDHIPRQAELYNQGIVMLRILKVLFRHITFDEVTSKPTLWRITEEQANKFIACLIKIGELDTYPIYPGALPSVKPRILSIGEQGRPGLPGLNGTNANINLLPEIGEDEIKVREVITGTVKTFYIDFVKYIQQLLTSSLSTGSTFEVGDSVNFNIILQSTKGTRDITSLICVDNTINALLQPLVNLVQLNGLTQPQTIVLPISNQQTTQTFTFRSSDSSNLTTTSVSINFFYPFISGNSDLTTGFDHYLLNKTIVDKSNRSFILNGTNKYFWIGFPASYGTLNSIKDQNGFEKIGDFTEVLVNVTSTGKAVNWTLSYRFYRTTLKTTINNAPYTITFN